MALAGQDLGHVVANYLNSAEFAGRNLLHTAAAAEDVRLLDLPGYRLYAPVTDEAVGRHVAAGTYERHVAEVLRQRLRRGMGVVDLGANIGVFAMLAASLVGPTGHVLAMEPNPANVRLLEASRLANGFEHLTICQAAAGQRVGVLVLNSFGSNGMATAVSDRRLLAAQTVAALPLDLLIAEDRWIDLIKIDVEGSEYLALQGGAALLRRCRPLLVSEFSPGLLVGNSGIDGPGYLRFLQGCGYRLDVIETDGSVTADLGVPELMAAYEASGVDHIDILAQPAF
jgi:FkbM family methyltransferase